MPVQDNAAEAKQAEIERLRLNWKKPRTKNLISCFRLSMRSMRNTLTYCNTDRAQGRP